MKEPIYRVVLRIIEVHEDAFRMWLYDNSSDAKEKEIIIDHFILASDLCPEVRRIYLTAKIFNSYTDAERCFKASLREFDFDKKSKQYFKDLRIERHFSNGEMRTLVNINELTGKEEEG